VFIEIRQRRAATFIVLRQEKPDKSQYAVINRSGRDIETWQLKASNAGAAAEPTRYKIAAGERHPVAWDRPMQGRVLAVQLPGVREPVQVKMEEFGEVKLPGELHGEVFADGYTRALRISDKATARSAVSSTRSGGTDEDLEARYVCVCVYVSIYRSAVSSTSSGGTDEDLEARYMCVYIYVCVCVYIYVYIYTYIPGPPMRTSRPGIYVCVCVYICIYCKLSRLMEVGSVSSVSRG
jgi:hypothetical protein